LWVVGPLRRGWCWESTAIPEIRMQAAELSQSFLQGSGRYRLSAAIHSQEHTADSTPCLRVEPISEGVLDHLPRVNKIPMGLREEGSVQRLPSPDVSSTAPKRSGEVIDL
jgi:hypothetical protein